MGVLLNTDKYIPKRYYGMFAFGLVIISVEVLEIYTFNDVQIIKIGIYRYVQETCCYNKIS